MHVTHLTTIAGGQKTIETNTSVCSPQDFFLMSKILPQYSPICLLANLLFHFFR
jgi:hypothetical protein